MKRLIIGIDLSFNSTGMTFALQENGIGKSIMFSRLVFEKKPNDIININQQTFNMPANVNVTDLIEDETDMYTEDQAHITLKAMICCKRLTKIILEQILKHDPTEVYFNIEGFIMPTMAGGNQLRVIGGLIMLQGMLRSKIIETKLTFPDKFFKIYITSPSELKLWFTGNGNADKLMMLQTFLSKFDGAKLLPQNNSLGQINDVVDSFALMLNTHWRLHTETERKLTKSQKKMEVAKAKQKEKKANKPKQRETVLFL